MNYIIVIAAFIVNTSVFANDSDWGQTGHRATGEIAENHLSQKAKREVRRILQGGSLALVSTYADEIKSDPDYKRFGPWHYVNLPKGETVYNPETASEEGDLLAALRKCKEVLKSKEASREEKEFYLKMLVHFMGDLHQPLHTGRGEDQGGNMIKVQWFGENSNLHRVWDSNMINSYQMGYTELARNTRELSGNEKRQITSGSFEDWMYESKALSVKVYNSVEPGENISYRYMYDWFPVVREQIQKGGVRLASVLNEIFG